MKFILCFSNLVETPSCIQLRQTPPPHQTAFESIATVVVPALRQFSPFDTIYAEPSVNCMALAGLLFWHLQPSHTEGLLDLGEHACESIVELQQRVTKVIAHKMTTAQGSMLFLTSSPAVFAGMSCFAKGQTDELSLLTEMQSLRVTSGWNVFECLGQTFTLLEH